jgi:hypothetical protein
MNAILHGRNLRDRDGRVREQDCYEYLARLIPFGLRYKDAISVDLILADAPM